MVPRLLRLHPSTYQRLARLNKEAEREGAYRVAKRLRAVALNSEEHTSGELAKILQAPRSKVSEWLQRYQTDGINGLLEGYHSGRPSVMSEKQQKRLGDILDSGLVAYGLDSGIWTSPRIAWVIETESKGRLIQGRVCRQAQLLSLRRRRPAANFPGCTDAWTSSLRKPGRIHHRGICFAGHSETDRGFDLPRN